jgi:hypothetical protein
MDKLEQSGKYQRVTLCQKSFYVKKAIFSKEYVKTLERRYTRMLEKIDKNVYKKFSEFFQSELKNSQHCVVTHDRVFMMVCTDNTYHTSFQIPLAWLDNVSPKSAKIAAWMKKLEYWNDVSWKMRAFLEFYVEKFYKQELREHYDERNLILRINGNNYIINSNNVLERAKTITVE